MGEIQPPDCSICFEPATTDLAAVSCGHVFHLKWYASIQREGPLGTWTGEDVACFLQLLRTPLGALKTLFCAFLCLEDGLAALSVDQWLASSGHGSKGGCPICRKTCGPRLKLRFMWSSAHAGKGMHDVTGELMIVRKEKQALETRLEELEAAVRAHAGEIEAVEKRLIGDAPPEDRAQLLLNDFRSWGRLEDAVLTLHRAMTVLQRDKERLKKEKLRQEWTAKKRLHELRKALEALQDSCRCGGEDTHIDHRSSRNGIAPQETPSAFGRPYIADFSDPRMLRIADCLSFHREAAPTVTSLPPVPSAAPIERELNAAGALRQSARQTAPAADARCGTAGYIHTFSHSNNSSPKGNNSARENEMQQPEVFDLGEGESYEDDPKAALNVLLQPVYPPSTPPGASFSLRLGWSTPQTSMRGIPGGLTRGVPSQPQALASSRSLCCSASATPRTRAAPLGGSNTKLHDIRVFFKPA
ncbi:zinc finger (c3hc4 ring finger) domain-containing protein [Cyclospora cayetanensis]|uniref:Zinc finger (C3hc4 ring finger) domain-containing protein n=1 Tax=Cyclospora cayetanensis TaxID=88456 RepID=A0A1D3CR97_9EIME|nr:zinc finger (c3hc4 ring finger) domain-containing protein [Cyclospora cayetanensis]